MFDWTNTYLELENSDVDTAVLMIGAIEQHGPHMPISVDWFVGDAVARGVAERLDAFLMPGFPSATRTPPRLPRFCIVLVPDPGRGRQGHCVQPARPGFRRIALINHNGGNIMVKPTCREINLSQDKGKVVHLLPSQVATESLSTIIESLHEEIHAGEFETSLMMHLAPEQVGPQRIDHVPDVEWTELDYRPLRDICPDGVWGRSSLATAEKGRLGLEMVIEATAAEFEEIFARPGGAGQVGTNPFTYATPTRHYSTLTRHLLDTYSTLIRHLCDT